MNRNLIIFVLCSMIVLGHSARPTRPPRPHRPIRTPPPSVEVIQTTFNGVNAVISSATNLATSALDSLHK